MLFRSLNYLLELIDLTAKLFDLILQIVELFHGMGHNHEWLLPLFLIF